MMNKMVKCGIGLLGMALGTCIMAQNVQKNGDIELATTDYNQDPTHVIVHTTNPITAAKLMGKGIRPLEIAVTNHGSKVVTLTHKSVQVRLADAYQLSRQFHCENQYISSLLLESFILAVLANGLWMSFTGPMALLTLLSLGGFPGGIAGYMYWSKISGQNEQMTAAFIRDALVLQQEKSIVVHPGQTVRRFLFLDLASRIDAFTFTVYDDKAQSSVARFSVYV